MKILLDPVYTANPSVCSTSYLCQEIIRELSAWRDDVFFYLMYPSKYSEDETELKFMTQVADRVTLLPVHQRDRERTREIFSMPPQLQTLLAPMSEFAWDTDMVVTSRLPQIVNIRAACGRRVNDYLGSHRSIVGLDEMPIFSFRPTVPWGASGEFDGHMLSSYLQADGVIVNNLWTEAPLKALARKHLPPSKVLDLGTRINEAVPVAVQRLNVRTDVRSGSEPLNVVFTGRMTSTRNFKGVAEVFRKHFAYSMGKEHVKFLVSTNSLSTGASDVGEVDFIDFQKNDRHGFLEFLDQTAHVAVNLSKVEDFSLSTYETLLNGVPMIVADEPWSQFLGADYPFRSKSTVAAYSLVKQFIDDYAGMYEKFRVWEATTWAHFVPKMQAITTSERMKDAVLKHVAKASVLLHNMDYGKLYRDAVATLTATDFATVDVRSWLAETGVVAAMDYGEKCSISRQPNLFLIPQLMKASGWRPTNKCGVFVR